MIHVPKQLLATDAISRCMAHHYLETDVFFVLLLYKLLSVRKAALFFFIHLAPGIGAGI